MPSLPCTSLTFVGQLVACQSGAPPKCSNYSEKSVWHIIWLFTSLIDTTDLRHQDSALFKTDKFVGQLVACQSGAPPKCSNYSEKSVWHTIWLFTSLIDKTDPRHQDSALFKTDKC